MPLALTLGCASSPALADSGILQEITVTGTRENRLLVETPAAVSLLSEETLEQDRPAHPAQVLGQMPGVAVAVTNGEGHTTAIRQPFTTNPVYLFLEDGIPTRSTGFFNHNALYEINLPQAGGVEVTRGPATALYGSDAIGGVVNVLTRTPPATGREGYTSLETGQNGWRRLLAGGGAATADGGWRADLNLTATDGWRERTAYERQSGTLRWDKTLDSSNRLRTVLAFSEVRQQTGANSPLVQADYENNPTRNYFPIAFRKVSALRLSSTWDSDPDAATRLSLTPYYRHDGMDLLASFSLNSDPTVYTTQNASYGLMAKWRRDFAPLRTRLILGADMEDSPGFRRENRILTTPTGSGAARVYRSYTKGARIYDYDVTYRGFSPYLHLEFSPTDRLRISLGLRHDSIAYAFDNHLPAGAVVAGPYYGQAASTTRRFSHASPKLGLTYALDAQTHLYASYNHGFRVPSENQLFRPARSATPAAAGVAVQSALGLRPIKANQAELGLRGRAGRIDYDIALYDLEKQDDILSARDTITNLTQTVNAGKTRHQGIELGAGLALSDAWRADLALSQAEHHYQHWLTSMGDFSGKEIESAPRRLVNARLTWQPRAGNRLQLEWVGIGAYWLDAANTVRYPGHHLLNLRGNWAITPAIAVFGSVYNLASTRYADSASISSGTPVYSPGLPRTLTAGVELRW
ncbi:MAG: TonB-dependent receptor [Proteobacteria bacterium]|nr:TonB-dependent receptor [Pseudomonadota bacterium]HQR04884.1 TonB-dependent receptor [Rhodocyclaceae bacterium]